MKYLPQIKRYYNSQINETDFLKMIWNCLKVFHGEEVKNRVRKGKLASKVSTVRESQTHEQEENSQTKRTPRFDKRRRPTMPGRPTIDYRGNVLRKFKMSFEFPCQKKIGTFQKMRKEYMSFEL